MHTAWKVRDGFTTGAISAIAQTPDGYLWLGTELGLLRFDGVKTVPFQPPAGQRLPSRVVRSLLVSRDGTLWIGTDQGLASWNHRQLTRYETPAERYVADTLLEDRDGAIWMTRYLNSWTLCQVQKDRVTCFGEDGGPGAGAQGLYEDAAGSLWIGTRTGLWRWKPGPPTFHALPAENNGVRGFAEAGDGTLLMSMLGGIRRFAGGQAVMEHPFPPSMQAEPAPMLLRDRDGGLWIGTSSHGLLHVHAGVMDGFSPADGLSGDDVRALFEDREGSIWVATSDGLDRFRRSAVVPYSVKQGLSSARVSSVLAGSDGSVWLGTFDGLNRWTSRQVTVYRERSARDAAGDARMSPRVREVAGAGIPAGVHSIFEDSQRRVWVSTARGVGYMEGERFVPLDGVPAGVTRAIVEDRNRTLWFVNVAHGLFRHVRGKEGVDRITWAQLQRTDAVTAVAADPSGDGLWLGFYRGGVARFAGDRVRAVYSSPEGLAPGRVSSLYIDRGGNVWAATESGLSRLRDGRATTLTSSNGLPCDAASWAIEDGNHALWVGMACGLVRIARSEVEAWMAGKRDIRAEVFDHTDGVRIIASASYYTAPAARAADGRLWFVSHDGVSVVDPARLPSNTLPPPVRIQRVIADRQTFEVTSEAGDALSLPPLVHDLQIDYTALSLVMPEKVRFRYQLEGHDREWQDAGNRRQAFYSDLAPGRYRFRVMASNNSGVWNEAGASLAFAVAPAYYQTAWFAALATTALVALAWGGHRLRLRVVEKHRGEISALNEQLMKAQEQERIRISGELHDGVMQEMLAVTMMLGTAKRRIPADSDARATIDKIQDKMIRVGTDIRRLSHDLHPPILQQAGLPRAVQAQCEEFSAASGIPVACDADDSTQELSRGAALALFRILQEALGNAAKHAAPRRITVRLTRSDGLVILSVSDDGVGFDRSRAGASGGLGLITVRERASQLDGRFELDSAPGRGTTITVAIPFR